MAVQRIFIMVLLAGLGVGCSAKKERAANDSINSMWLTSDFPVQTKIISTGAVANLPHWVWITGNGFTKQTRVLIKDAQWNLIKIYEPKDLVMNLSEVPQVITLALGSSEERVQQSDGLIATVEGGAGTWDSARIEPPTLNLLLVMGQSNAVGFRGDSAQLPYDPSDALVPFAYTDGNPGTTCVSSSWSIQPLQPQPSPSPCLDSVGGLNYLYAYSPGFGPEFGLSRRLTLNGKGGSYGIFKFAWNGSSLSDDWNPDATSGNRLYAKFEVGLNQTIANLEHQGFKVKVSALIWMQGESDAANATAAAAYRTNLVRFLDRVRVTAKNSDLPLIAGLIAPYRPRTSDAQGNFWIYSDTVRSALTSVAARTVETADLPTDWVRSADDVHYNSSGLLTLGERFAEALLSLGVF